MKIVGLEGLDGNELQREIERGAKFVIYQYCISVVLLTLKRPSDIYFVRAGEGGMSKGLGFSMISLVLGWWGIPWGPIYTVGSLITNFGGGKDVTREVLASLQPATA